MQSRLKMTAVVLIALVLTLTMGACTKKNQTAAPAGRRATTLTRAAAANHPPAAAGRPRWTDSVARRTPSPTSRSLWPPLTTDTTSSGLSRTAATTHRGAPERTSTAETASAAAAASAWKATRAASADPAVNVTIRADNRVKPGP